ncbi:MAG: hypothetical protein J2P41_03240, partial [Blastocatellia bacterium]|nr:hypothetical protein [Blastocatellia bacterium]
MKLTVVVFVLASAVLAFKTSALPAVFGSQTQEEEKALLQKVCGTCHALDRVTTSRRSRAQWGETMEKMISLGAKATDQEFATILAYLV